MSWYKKSSTNAPQAMEYVVNNNYAKANLDFEDNGYWFEEQFVNIPISRIKHKNWSPIRYDDNLEKIKQTEQMPPVIAYFDANKGVYELTDGNHRVSAAKELGYTHVPAVVSFKRHYAPPYDVNIAYERMKQHAFYLGMKIRDKKQVDWVDIEGTNSNQLVIKVETHEPSYSYKYIITGTADANGFDLMMNGKRYRGDMESVSTQLAQDIKGIGD